MQSGEVILTYCGKGRVEPRLVTSRSHLPASLRQIDISHLLPLPGGRVGYVVMSDEPGVE